MRNKTTIYDFLANSSMDEVQAKRFDIIYDCVSDDAKAEMDKICLAFENSLKGIGEVGAKFPVMRLHDHLNMSEAEQKQAVKHGLWLHSLSEE